MRIQGNLAYEVEPVLDPATLVRSGWRYKVYPVRPIVELLRSGGAESREAAEQAGRCALDLVIKSEHAAHRPSEVGRAAQEAQLHY